jgi:hypothetical protein
MMSAAKPGSREQAMLFKAIAATRRPGDGAPWRTGEGDS